MSDYIIKIDFRRCINCGTCEVQCQIQNRLPEKIKLGRLITGESVSTSGRIKTTSAFMPCFHCEQPWCVAACPTQAMVRRVEDGIVYVDQDRCVGCKACIIACPWQVPQWNEASGKVMKCDYCLDRLADGLTPACVTACATHALSFGRPDHDVRKTRNAYARALCVDKEWL